MADRFAAEEGLVVSDADTLAALINLAKATSDDHSTYPSTATATAKIVRRPTTTVATPAPLSANFITSPPEIGLRWRLSLFAIFKRELLHYHAELMPMAHRRHTSPPAVCGLSGGATTGWRGRPARALFGPRAEPWEVFSPQLKRANRDYPPLRDGADAGLRQEPAGSRRRVFSYFSSMCSRFVLLPAK